MNLDYLKYFKNENSLVAKSKPKVTVLVAFYNNCFFLECLLASLEVQSFSNFEVIICDDGSKLESVQQVSKIISNLKIPVTHLWQSDDGFRKNELLNKALLQAKSEYIVFLDQDCICHPEFIADHFSRREKSVTLTGRRVELNSFVTKMLTADKIRNSFLQRNFWWIFFAIAFMKDNNNFKGLRFTSSWMQFIFNRRHRGVVGCNFSVHKSDLERVNGFDSRYRHPGTGEDSDIEYRMNQLGIQTKPLCHLAIQYHMYHKLQKRSVKNDQLFQEIKDSKSFVTEYGMKQVPQAAEEFPEAFRSSATASSTNARQSFE